MKRFISIVIVAMLGVVVMGSSKPVQAQTVASYCCNAYNQAICSMAVAIPVGYACQCPGVYGVGHGC